MGAAGERRGRVVWRRGRDGLDGGQREHAVCAEGVVDDARDVADVVAHFGVGWVLGAVKGASNDDGFRVGIYMVVFLSRQRHVHCCCRGFFTQGRADQGEEKGLTSVEHSQAAMAVDPRDSVVPPHPHVAILVRATDKMGALDGDQLADQTLPKVQAIGRGVQHGVRGGDGGDGIGDAKDAALVKTGILLVGRLQGVDTDDERLDLVAGRDDNDVGWLGKFGEVNVVIVGAADRVSRMFPSRFLLFPFFSAYKTTTTFPPPFPPSKFKRRNQIKSKQNIPILLDQSAEGNNIPLLDLLPNRAAKHKQALGRGRVIVRLRRAQVDAVGSNSRHQARHPRDVLVLERRQEPVAVDFGDANGRNGTCGAENGRNTSKRLHCPASGNRCKTIDVIRGLNKKKRISRPFYLPSQLGIWATAAKGHTNGRPCMVLSSFYIGWRWFNGRVCHGRRRGKKLRRRPDHVPLSGWTLTTGRGRRSWRTLQRRSWTRPPFAPHQSDALHLQNHGFWSKIEFKRVGKRKAPPPPWPRCL